MPTASTKTTAPAQDVSEQPTSKGQVAVFSPPRLPYHPKIEETFGIDKGTWKVLVEAIFPAAKTVDAIAMALSYCKSRGLDVMKRPVHIVPMWDSARGAMVETVWPGISELRTTASRTKGYAGCDVAEFGTKITMDFKGRVNRKGQWVEETIAGLEFPEWCRITVYRVVDGQRCKFVGPKVAWLETYATQGNSELPNKMWQERPEGQLEKCAEAAALRRAFPEEIGNELTAEEMTGRGVHDLAIEVQAITDHPAGAQDTAPPRQIAAPTEPPHDAEEARDGTPPRRASKPADKPDPISSGPQRAPKDTGPNAKLIEPFKIPGTNETFESWSEKYIDNIRTSPDLAAAYAWIDKNSDPLGRLSKGKPSVYAGVKKATESVMQALKDAAAKAADKSAKKAAPKPAAAAPSDMDDAPTGEMDGALNMPIDPEAILRAIDAELSAVEDPDLLQECWDKACEPLLAKLDFPPDIDLAQSCFDKHSRRLGGD